MMPISKSLVQFVRGVAVLSAAIWSSVVLADTKAGYDMWNRGDYAAAVAQWRPLAIAGDPVAQFDMAQAYKLGRGVPIDTKRAERWYAKAAAQGHVSSRDNYGLILFQNGNRAAAMPYIEESAGRGEPRAQYVLATALFNGDGMGTDRVRAYALMTRASSAGIAAASLSLARMDGYMPLDQRQRGLALAQTLEQAATAARATATLGEVVASGPAVRALETIGVTQTPRVPKGTTASKSVTVVGEGWRVQLGAFGDAAKAKALWTDLHTRIAALGPYRSFITVAGPVTRMQAGPMASHAAAATVCAAVKAANRPCLPIAP